MGTSTLFDIVSSTMVAGILLLMVLRLNMQANEASALYNTNLTLQENMTALVGIIEHDFRRIGYCKDYTKIPEPTRSIRIADSSRIRFWLDVDNKGRVDSITYYLGDPDLSTINPRDRILFRQVNTSPPQAFHMGVTVFRLRYFDADGDTLVTPVADPREVYLIDISVGIEAPAPFQVLFQAARDGRPDSVHADFQQFWRQIRLAARNLRNR
jgi:hypothetical protein